MKKQMRIVFLAMLLVFLALTSTVFAESSTDVKYNGVYHYATYIGQGHYMYYYYRFFPNQTAATFSSPMKERLQDVYKALEVAPSGKGKYTVENGEIKFTFSYAKGTVDYTATVNGDTLNLSIHSNILNTYGKAECTFYEVN